MIAVLLLAALAVAVMAAPAQAAAPRYILVTGPGLEQPLMLSNWSDNLKLYLALLPARRPGAAGWQHARPRYDLALFWGVPAKPVPSNPAEANQHGWFYPAVGGRRAVIKLLIDGQDFPRVATPEALRILARQGVPTRA